MSVTIRGQVGPQTLQDGAEQALRTEKSGALVVQELHGRYYEQAYRKNFFTAYAVAQATSVVGTAMVGLQVYNGSPTSSGVNLVLSKWSVNIVVTSASTTSIVLATGAGQLIAPTGQTAATRVANNFIGGQAPQALATSAGTFTNAPTALLTLLHNTAAIAATGEDAGAQGDLEGSIIIPPQFYVCFAAVGAAVAASGSNMHLMWEEVPV